MKKGFTLIELLVVVLIIGILSAIALPQYQKAVFKSRLSEVMVNLKTIGNCFDMYVLEHGLPAAGSTVYMKDMGCTVELTGGQWTNDYTYKTKNFIYDDIGCGHEKCHLHVSDKGFTNDPTFAMNDYENDKICFTQNKPLGRMACKMFEEHGWTYEDDVW